MPSAHNQETKSNNQLTAPHSPRENKVIKTILDIAKELFIFSLIFYLVLFIFETLFPGFVSYNFDLNWVLYAVLFLGVVAAFAPPEEEKVEEEKKKPKIIDYLTAIVLGLIGGALIFYRLDLEIVPRTIIAVVSGVLVIGLGLVLLLVEDEEIKEREAEIEEFVDEKVVSRIFSRKLFTTPIALFRILMFKKVNFSLLLIFIVFFLSALSLPKKSEIKPRQINLNLKLPKIDWFKPKVEEASKQEEIQIQNQEPSATPTPKPTPSDQIMIKVLNGGIGENRVVSIVEELKQTGFVKVFFGSADRQDYQNATIRFRPEDKQQEELIKELLLKNFSSIAEAPAATTSAEITVILGKRSPEEDVGELQLE